MNFRFQKEKTWKKLCVFNHGDMYLFRFTYTYMQITLHWWFRWRQKCRLWFLRCLPFWTPCLFLDFLSFTSDFLFQLFNAGKIWEMLQLNKVRHRALRQHNLIFLVSFVLLLSPKQSKCLTSFHLQLIGGIWLAQKFAFNIDKFQ